MKAAVLGFPIEHSLSPYLHLLLASGCGIELEYKKFPTEIRDLKSTVKRLSLEGYIGFNCTMPLKTEAVKYCDTLSPESTFLQSVNTVKYCKSGIHGSTTDGKGMLTPVNKVYGNVESKTVLILGTGGTARSIALSFSDKKANVKVICRSKGIMGEMFPDIVFLPFEKLKEEAQSCDILINATPLGMENFEEFSDLSFINYMKKTSLVCDAVYNPLNTRLIQSAKNNNILTVDGLSMLVYQGVHSFYEWTGIMPSNSVIEKTYSVLRGE